MGATATLSARATFADGSTRDCTNATWASSNSAVATVSSAGVLLAVGAGTSDIRASCGTVSGTGRVSVALRRTVVSVAVTGIPTDYFIPGDTARLTAKATYSDAAVVDCTTTAVWSSSNLAIASVATGGALAAMSPGQADIRASCDGTTGSGQVTVVVQPPPPQARLFTSYDNSQVMALWRVTSVWFDASRSTGVGLTYLVEFGDGTNSTETTAWHVPALDWLTMSWGGRLTVTDRWGRVGTATAQYRLTSFDWGQYIYWPCTCTKATFYDLGQDRANPTRLHARAQGFGNDSGQTLDFTGTVYADRYVYLVTRDGGVELTGTFSTRDEYGYFTLRLHVKGGRLDGQTLSFYKTDPY